MSCTKLSHSLSSQASSTVPVHDASVLLLQGDLPTHHRAIFQARRLATSKGVVAGVSTAADPGFLEGGV